MEAGHITPPRGAVRSSSCHRRPIGYSNIVVNLWKVLFGRLDRARRHENIAAMAATYTCLSIDQRAAADETKRDDTLRGRRPAIPAQLEEDQFHMLWLVHRNQRNSGRVQILLSAALQNGWRIVTASPEEQALLQAHGFGSGRVQ
jgi:hypothetical protein